MCGDSYMNINVLKFIELYKRKKVILLYDHVKKLNVKKYSRNRGEGSAVPGDSAGRGYQAVCKKVTCEHL